MVAVDGGGGKQMDRVSRSIAIPSGPSGPDFQLHKLGWRNFQEFCGVVLREVLGQSLIMFADSNDAGRDGAYYGRWVEHPLGATGLPDGATVVQCKFSADPRRTLSLSGVREELDKVSSLVSSGLCQNYVLATNARVTGRSEALIVDAFKGQGAVSVVILDGSWINTTIAQNSRLRSYVPRVYGLGDLSQILDERAYRQADAVLDYLRDDLSTFVVTEAYTRAVKAISEHGFLLLLGEPAVGKSIIAATLAVAAVDNWSCTPLKLDSPAEFNSNWNADESQLIWIDDAFGAVRHEQYLTQAWARKLPKVMAAVRKKTRIIMTSRDYIYSEARAYLKESSFPLLREGAVVVDVGHLSPLEREKIVYNHVKLGDQAKSTRARLKCHLAAAAKADPFRPEMARRLGQEIFTRNLTFSEDGVVDFVTRPQDFLSELYDQLDQDLRAALALVYILNPLPSPMDTVAGVDVLCVKLGSTLARVSECLSYLIPSFLRHGKVAEESWARDGWEFRHPTLREGFAEYIGNNPNLLEIYLLGLEPRQLLMAIDCDLEAGEGSLLWIPPVLYPVVAEKVAEVTRSRSGGGVTTLLNDSGIKDYFLANRTSRDFLEIYLEKDPTLVDQILPLGPYLSVGSGPPVLAKLRKVGLLSEAHRKTLVAQVSDLAVEIPDSSWVDDPDFDVLIDPEERAEIVERIRVEFVSDLDDVLDSWRMNEQNEASEYYEPLEDALKDYGKLLSASPAESARLQDALEKAVDQRNRAMADQDEEDMSKGESGKRSPQPFLGGQSAGDSEATGRSIFDDVDE